MRRLAVAALIAALALAACDPWGYGLIVPPEDAAAPDAAAPAVDAGADATRD